jgi:hypothetical protein
MRKWLKAFKDAGRREILGWISISSPTLWGMPLKTPFAQGRPA